MRGSTVLVLTLASQTVLCYLKQLITESIALLVGFFLYGSCQTRLYLIHLLLKVLSPYLHNDHVILIVFRVMT